MISLLKWAWEETKKQPMLAGLFAAVIALGYIYVDLRKATNKNSETQIEINRVCGEKVAHLENTVTFMQHEKRVSDSTLSALNAQWKLMQKLGYIKLPD